MAKISLSAEAAQPILAALQAKKLEMGGLLLRDPVTKQIRYILGGLENLPQNADAILQSPSLGPLREAMSVQQIQGAIAIAQNAANAASLARIEDKLADIEARLSDMDKRLGRVECGVDLVIAGMRDGPINRLRASCNSWHHADRHGDVTAKIAACLVVETSARDLLGQARHLVQTELDGLPAALIRPKELRDLVEAAFDAAVMARKMHHDLGQVSLGVGLLEEFSETVGKIRATIDRRLRDPELLLRRVRQGLANDADLIETGMALRRSKDVADAVCVFPDADPLQAAPDKSKTTDTSLAGCGKTSSQIVCDTIH